MEDQNRKTRGWWLSMNLQLFAEGDSGAAEGSAGSESGQQEGEKTYTLDEVMKLVQSETDKRVTQAMKRQAKEFEKKLSLSGLDEQERANAEKDQHIGELEEKLQAETARANRLELVKILASRSLPVEFADMIDIGTDMQVAQKRIDALDSAFKKAVEDAVNQRISGKAVPGNGSGARSTMTREDIMKIKDPTERQAAIRDNMELFQKRG